jgi:hypothetical protein
MSDVLDPNRLGQANKTGVTDALFLKVFSNEILATFEKTQIMKPLHTIRTISSGKSATFPTLGVASSLYHSPGEDIMSKDDGSGGSKYNTKFNMNEVVISIDKMLVSSTFIPNIEELHNHFDVRGQFSKELGIALAQRFDKAILKTLAAGAAASGKSDQPDGIQIGSQTLDTGAGLVSALTKVAQKLDENDVPDDGTRFAVLTPAQYYTLVGQDNIAINRDFGGTGNVSSGSLTQVAGINIYKSNNLTSVLVADASQNQDDDNAVNDPFGSGNGYNAALNTVGFLAGHPSGVGTVKLLDLATESDYSVAHQGTLFVAKYAMGHNVLRPSSCVTVS